MNYRTIKPLYTLNALIFDLSIDFFDLISSSFEVRGKIFLRMLLSSKDYIAIV